MQVLKRLTFMVVFLIPITAWSSELHYALEVEVNPAKSMLSGQARLSTDVTREVSLFLQNIKNLWVEGQSIAAPIDDYFRVRIQKGGTIHLAFEVDLANAPNLYLDQEHLMLTGNWYPMPDTLAVYHLSATLPHDFIAISEAEAVLPTMIGDTTTYSFQFNHPLDSLTLVASSRYHVEKRYHNNIALEAYFFKEDRHLADSYTRLSGSRTKIPFPCK